MMSSTWQRRYDELNTVKSRKTVEVQKGFSENEAIGIQVTNQQTKGSLRMNGKLNRMKMEQAKQLQRWRDMEVNDSVNKGNNRTAEITRFSKGKHDKPETRQTAECSGSLSEEGGCSVVEVNAG